MSETTATGLNQARYDLRDFPLEAAPEGEIEAVFVQGFWGRSSNLFSCFVTDEGCRFRLSTFSRKGYAPYDDGPSLKGIPPGQRLHLTIGRSRDGRPVFLRARTTDV